MQLSEEQKKAVYAKSSKALCIAGAGSGKTRVLTSRVQHLIEDCQVSPYEIVSLTFTRKASGEMRERLETAIGNKAFNVTMGTIHSFALNMIQRFGEYVGLNPSRVTVYSDWEESVLLKDVCIELGYHTGKNFKGVKKKEIDKAFYILYTEGKRDDEAYTANSILDAFLTRCKENNALTYGTILTTFVELLPKISHMLNYKHVMIDEVQDNDKLQWSLINLLCELCEASLFVVGDISQAIFSFRGGDPEYLTRHKKEFDIYTLEDNYRSDGYIVDSANKLIVNNEIRLDGSMNAKRQRINEISTMNNMDSEQIVNQLKETPIDDENSLTILARNHFLLKKLSRLLRESEIDHDYVGNKTALTRSEEFRKVHAFLKLSTNPFDNFSFLLMKDILEIENYREIRMQAVKEDKSHFQVWSEQDFSGFQWLVDYVEYSSEQNFSGIIELLKKLDFGFDASIILAFVEEYMSSKYNPSIEGYLNWLAIYDVQDEITEKSKNIQLMTIHASKGLEFDNVIIAGMNEGILPSSRAEQSQRELESERRLAYVAYTRAKNNLILTSRPLVDKDGDIKYKTSRFISESF